MGAWTRIVTISRSVHTYATMFGLLAISFFAVSGLMLNHPGWFGLDDNRSVCIRAAVPTSCLQPPDKEAILASLRAQMLKANLPLTGTVEAFDVDDTQITVIFTQPGRRCQATIATADGSAEVTHESRGLPGLLADLHRGASAGRWWRLFIDIAAGLLSLAVLTGIVIWLSLPRRRLLGALALLVGVVMFYGAYRWLAG